MFIIGIAGGTGSGKTTVVRKLIERLPKGEVVVIPQDSYYKDSSNVPVEERQNINFDHPDAFDWNLLTKHIAMLKDGQAIEQPIYSYITCTRSKETIHIEPKEVIIVEGIMALREPNMRKQMDLKIFVDADADDRLIRLKRLSSVTNACSNRCTSSSSSLVSVSQMSLCRRADTTTQRSTCLPSSLNSSSATNKIVTLTCFFNYFGHI